MSQSPRPLWLRKVGESLCPERLPEGLIAGGSTFESWWGAKVYAACSMGR